MKTVSRVAQPVRYVAIDGLRFLAAMGVVFLHYSLFTGNDFLVSLFAKNYLFVDFFFAISGFVIFHSYGDRLTSFLAYVDFLKNRIARVYPLHFLTLIMMIVLAATVWRDKIDRAFIDPSTILPNLMLVHAWGATQVMSFNYPSWSISAEWFAYLTFPAVVWIVRRGGATAALIVAGVIVAMLEMAVYRGLLAPWTTLTNHFGALRALPTFLIGAAIAQGLDRIPLRLKTFAPSWGLFVAAFGAMLLHFDDRLIVVMLIACLIATVVAERDGATGLLTRPLMARFGDYSYAIYMIHPLIAVVFINLVSGKILHLSGAWLMIWCAFCAVVPNVLIGSLIYRRVESPARRWIRNSQPLRALRWLWAEGAAKRKSW